MNTTKTGNCLNCKEFQNLKILVASLATVRRKTKTSVVKWYHDNDHRLWSSQ